MKKVTKSKVNQTKNDTNGISYGLRRKAVQNDSEPKFTVTKTKSKPVTNKNIRSNSIKETPTKKLTVLSTKIRSPKVKQLTDDLTSKTCHLDKKTISRNKKTNEIKTAEAKLAVKNSTSVLKNNRESVNDKLTVLSTKIRSQRTKHLTDALTPKTRQLDKKTPVIRNSKKRNKNETEETPKTKSNSTTVLKKNVIPEVTNSINNVTVRVERLSNRLLKLHAGKEKSNTAQNKPLENKKKPKKTAQANSTPQNMKPSPAEKKSAKPVRVLRKRNNAIVNKYKDITLDSPLLKKPQKPASSNPLAVYDFEFDPSEEPAKKRNRKQKCESDSSGEEDKSMRLLLKKLRKANKKVNVKKKKVNKNKVLEIKQVAKEQNKTDQINTNPKKISNKTIQNLIEEKQIKPVILAEKQKPEQMPVNNKNNLPEIKSNIFEKQNNVQKIIENPELSQISVNDIEMDSPSDNSDPIDLISDVDENIVEEEQTEPIILAEKQNPKQLPVNNKNNLPQISISDVEMISLSDKSDPISAVDPSIQARNIVEEVTKSFIEDLSDEDSNSPGKIQILSNEGNTKKNKTKIFNSTTYGLKPSRPWRIDVSSIRKKPHIFTYKDKSFTPRYEPDYDYVITENNVQPNKEDKNDANQENIKLTYQTSILNFVKGANPKIAKNKIAGLFSDLPKKVVQSPRKVLGEINYIQSTPLKAINNFDFLNSPNISIISPKKKSADEMFGFSYFSDDEENKENNIRRSPRKSPKKIKQKTSNLVNEAAHQAIVNINQDKENNIDKIVNTIQEKDNDDKAMEEENLTVQEPEMLAASIDTNLSIPLFQDIDNQLEVCKKSTRKYVKKHAKRKRLLSVDTIHSGDESDPESLPQKKKRKNARTEEEEKEADRLASHYNSMFEEIEKYPLLIE